MLKGDQCILLSFFSGIEAAGLVVTRLIGSPILRISWGIDEGCKKIIAKHFPMAKIRGDILTEEAQAIIGLIDRHDPGVVLFLAAPPCPDFSVISQSAKGLQGDEGSKLHYSKLAREIEQGLGTRDVRHLVENVIFQQKSEAQHMSNELNASPVVADSSDFGLIGRPRLWWSRIEWRQVQFNPITGKPLKWGTYPKLHIEAPLDEVEHIYTDGHSFHLKVSQHIAFLQCLMTPAPDEYGRAAPKKSRTRTDPETRNRWLEGGRQYAPWHYQEHALLRDPGGNLVVPPITIKEQVHHFPYNYTQHAEVEDRQRHRMLGNSWHVGVAMFMLLLLLQTPTTGDPIECETQSTGYDVSTGSSS